MLVCEKLGGGSECETHLQFCPNWDDGALLLFLCQVDSIDLVLSGIVPAQ